MEPEPFFHRDGDSYVPTSVARGPWSPNSLHGRLIAGLLGHVIDQTYGDPDLTPARLTVDMYRLPDLSPVQVTTRVVRDGYRIKVIDAEFISAGKSCGRATSQLLRRTAAPGGTVWSPTPWDAPLPAALPAPDDKRAGMGGIWATRPIVGAMGTMGPRRIWLSDIRELVGGEPMTPLTRVALAADFASPFANAGDKGLEYINSDMTIYLHRLPVTEWIGFEVVNHHATDGVAIGECWLHDEQGPIGTSSVAALAQKMGR